jgi:hypothetical protein
METLRTLSKDGIQTPDSKPARTGLLQRKCECGNHTMGGDCATCRNDGTLQRAAIGSPSAGNAPPIVHEVLRSSGRPLDPATRDFFEPRFGHDFSQVRIHTGPQASASASSIGARAYTVGREIVFRNEIGTGMNQGKELMAHELAHVVQQGGRPACEMTNLSMTAPGDASEREADRAATAITTGEQVQSQSVGRTVLARALDTRIYSGPTDVPGPAEAGPKPGAPGTTDAGNATEPSNVVPPKPKPPMLGPPPVIVDIDPVKFGTPANRLPPTKEVAVPVAITNLPAGSAITMDVEGSGGVNGSATITAGASLTSSGNVTVKGGAQTNPGNAGKLKLRASFGTSVVGRSAGFTVAAYPINYTDVFKSDINDGTLLGMVVQDGWSSDGSGSITELDKVEISEQVDNQSRDNPPFTIEGASTGGIGSTSGYIAANSFTTDTFQMAKSGIDTTGLGVGTFNRVQGQLCLFKCLRTGVTDVVMPASGYKIIQRVYNADTPPKFKHKTLHVPSAITVHGHTATAGGGTAETPEHIL